MYPHSKASLYGISEKGVMASSSPRLGHACSQATSNVVRSSDITASPYDIQLVRFSAHLVAEDPGRGFQNRICQFIQSIGDLDQL